MKSYYSVCAILSLTLTFSSQSFADDWMKTSDHPAGTTQYKIKTGYDNGDYVTFVVASDGAGLFRSSDGGLNWVNIGLVGKLLTDIHDSNSIEGEYIVSASDGIYKTTDGGANWQHYTTGIEGLFVTDILSFGNLLYIGTVGGGVFSSSDGGETWQQYGTGLENKTVLKLSISDTSPYKIYALTQEDGVNQLDTFSNTWLPVNDGAPSLFNNTAITIGNSGKLFLANFDFGVYSSPNDPVFWQQEINFPFANDFVATPDGKVFASSFGNGIMQRDVNGNWSGFSSGIPEDPDGYIDVGNLGNFTIWWSENAQTEQYLWAAYTPLHPSMTAGIYRTVNPVSDAEANSTVTLEDFRLEQNYPNPFNPSTTISYSIPNNSFVTIKIYDVLGNQIAELVNEEKSIGVHELTFDASNLSTGTYFYQLQAVSSSSNSGENFVETKKMILIK